MPNHYHFLLETPEANLVAGMKWFQGTYTQRFNSMFQCRGHLFQGRYKALPIETDPDTDYFRAVGNYIHMNPYRAGLAGKDLSKTLEAYKWSSCDLYFGSSRKCPSWLVRSRLLNACDINEQDPLCFAQYQSVLEAQMSESDDPRDEAIKKQLKRGWYIGGDSFKRWLTQGLPSHSDNLRGAQRRAHNEAEAERLIGVALNTLSIEEEDLLAMTAVRPEKQVIAWLLKRSTTVTGVWIASRLKMGHRSSVSRALLAMDKNSNREREKLKQKVKQCTG